MTFPPPIILAADLDETGLLFHVRNRCTRRARTVLAVRDARKARRTRVARPVVVDASPDPLATSGQPGEIRERGGLLWRWVPDHAIATPPL